MPPEPTDQPSPSRFEDLPRQLSLLHLLWLIGAFSIPIMVGTALQPPVSVWVRTAASVGAFAGALLLGPVLVMMLRFWAWRVVPILPRCRNGTCRAEHYRWLRDQEAGGLAYQCRCGDLYGKQGDRFVWIRPDGRPSAYLRRAGWRQWAPDDAYDDLRRLANLTGPTRQALAALEVGSGARLVLPSSVCTEFGRAAAEHAAGLSGADLLGLLG
jgi:hypothetical protein